MPRETFAKFQRSYSRFFDGHLAPLDAPELGGVETAEVMWGGLRWRVQLRHQQGVIEFVPAIQQRRVSGKGMMERAIGVLHNLPQPDELDDLMESAVQAASAGSNLPFRPAGAPGTRFETDVLTLTVDLEPVRERLAAAGYSAEAKQLAASLISFDAAYAMAAAAALELELGDFGRTWRLLNDSLRLYYYDMTPGGNGIAATLYRDWVTDLSVANRAAHTILRSSCCTEFCDRCILLPRTPEPFVRKGLLSKRFAAALVST